MWLHVWNFYGHIQWPNDVSLKNLKCLRLCKQEIGGGVEIRQAKLPAEIQPPPAKCPLMWLHVWNFYGHIQWPNGVSQNNLKCLRLCKQEIGGGWCIWQAKLAGCWTYPVYIYIQYVFNVVKIYIGYIEYILNRSNILHRPPQACELPVTHLNSRDNWRKVTWSSKPKTS